MFKQLGQNQAELAWLAVLYFWRPYKSRHSNFRVAYTVKTFSQSIRECETGSISIKSITLTLKDVESSLDRPTSHKVSKIEKNDLFQNESAEMNDVFEPDFETLENFCAQHQRQNVPWPSGKNPNRNCRNEKKL